MSVQLLTGKTIEASVQPISVIQDVVDAVASSLKLGTKASMFQLFEVTPHDEIHLSPKLRLSDWLATHNVKNHLQFSVAYYDPIDLHHPTLVHLIYCQTVHELQKGRYFKPDEDYYALSALILQERLQDFSSDNRLLWYFIVGLFSSHEISSLLPPHLAQSDRRMVSETEVQKVYSKLRGYTPQECQISLLQYVWSWEEYGITHFLGKVGLDGSPHL